MEWWHLLNATHCPPHWLSSYKDVLSSPYLQGQLPPNKGQRAQDWAKGKRMNGVRQAALSKGDQGGLSKVVAFELCPEAEEPDVPRKITPVRKNGR